jgi:hypothetical protein
VIENYDHKVTVALTTTMLRHLELEVGRSGVGRSEILRAFIADGLADVRRQRLEAARAS